MTEKAIKVTAKDLFDVSQLFDRRDEVDVSVGPEGLKVRGPDREFTLGSDEAWTISWVRGMFTD